VLGPQLPESSAGCQEFVDECRPTAVAGISSEAAAKFTDELARLLAPVGEETADMFVGENQAEIVS
jgi:hypothetical protein